MRSGAEAVNLFFLGCLEKGGEVAQVNALGAFAVLRVAKEPPVVGQGVAGQGRDSSPCSLVPVCMWPPSGLPCCRGWVREAGVRL